MSVLPCRGAHGDGPQAQQLFGDAKGFVGEIVKELAGSRAGA